ncbi:uncharacterized protein LOC115964513 [Quercus lobata]|uniref:uncharacterized protein LOC115964513 n=1 Tax=Quercus lobata TaxID=97700 RepID=UPI00124644EB|nr:uncharacterized protein LOC115964513 [Quercus lobata]
MFHPFDADDILQVPLSRRVVQDVVVWSGSKKGNYTMKFGYYVAKKLRMEESNLRESSRQGTNGALWSRIWQANVRNKIKIFSWRACLNILPTQVNLARRRVVEKTSKIKYYAARFSAAGYKFNAETFKGGMGSVLGHLLANMESAQYNHARGCILASFKIISASIGVFERVHRGTRPVACFSSNSVYAAIAASGYGAVIRNEKGEVMAALAAKGGVVRDSEEVEVLACHKALEFAIDAGFMEIILEGFRSISINCVRHIANGVAHALARFARLIDDDIVLLEEDPPPVVDALYLDANALN